MDFSKVSYAVQNILIGLLPIGFLTCLAMLIATIVEGGPVAVPNAIAGWATATFVSLLGNIALIFWEKEIRVNGKKIGPLEKD